MAQGVDAGIISDQDGKQRDEIPLLAIGADPVDHRVRAQCGRTGNDDGDRFDCNRSILDAYTDGDEHRYIHRHADTYANRNIHSDPDRDTQSNADKNPNTDKDP